MSTLHALAIDIETTGTDPEMDAVVELAAVGVRIDLATGRYEALETLFTSLVDPGRGIPAASAAAHDFTEPDAQGQPGLAWARAELQASVRDFRPRLLVTHHAEFKAGFLPGLAGALTPDDVRWTCTRRLAKHLWPGARDFSLLALCRACGLQEHAAGHDAHRPAFDAAGCAVLLAAQCRALTEAGHDVTPALLREWSATVPVEARVPFGRYRGRYWHEVPRDYLAWLLDRHRSGDPFAPEIVAAAEAALRGVDAVPPAAPANPCARA